jgi:hypothetical protein
MTGVDKQEKGGYALSFVRRDAVMIRKPDDPIRPDLPRLIRKVCSRHTFMKPYRRKDKCDSKQKESEQPSELHCSAKQQDLDFLDLEQ